MKDVSLHKEKIETELQELTEQLQALGIHNPEVSEDWIATPEGTETSESDANVGADRAEDWIEKNATVAQLETRYNNLQRALKKIASGTYGLCEIDGSPIEEDRLNANAAARTCKAHIDKEANLPLV